MARLTRRLYTEKNTLLAYWILVGVDVAARNDMQLDSASNSYGQEALFS